MCIRMDNVSFRAASVCHFPACPSNRPMRKAEHIKRFRRRPKHSIAISPFSLSTGQPRFLGCFNQASSRSGADSTAWPRHQPGSATKIIPSECNARLPTPRPRKALCLPSEGIDEVRKKAKSKKINNETFAPLRYEDGYVQLHTGLKKELGIACCVERKRL